MSDAQQQAVAPMMDSIPLAVTTSLKPDAETLRKAAALAADFAAPLLARTMGTLAELAGRSGAERLLLAERDRLRLWDIATSTEYAYHPNLLPVRGRLVVMGGHDLFVDAAQLEPGQSVLDCTLGFGTEATLASWLVGPEGSVTGLECEPPLAAVTRAGMAAFPLPMAALREAMRRVRVLTADFTVYLPAQPSASVDIICFDPFFFEPLTRSEASVSPLSVFGGRTPLHRETVDEACRVARLRVVIKRPKNDPLPADWGASHVVTTHKSRVLYHVWEMQ